MSFLSKLKRILETSGIEGKLIDAKVNAHMKDALANERIAGTDSEVETIYLSSIAKKVISFAGKDAGNWKHTNPNFPHIMTNFFHSILENDNESDNPSTPNHTNAVSLAAKISHAYKEIEKSSEQGADISTLQEKKFILGLFVYHARNIVNFGETLGAELEKLGLGELGVKGDFKIQKGFGVS